MTESPLATLGLEPLDPEEGEPRPESGDEDAEDDQADLAVIPPWRPTVWGRVAEAWHGRALWAPLARRTVPTYRGRILGRAWIVLRPFMQVFGFGLLFGGVFKAQAPNGLPYILYLIFGMQAFRFFELSVLYETLSPRMLGKQTRNLRVPLLLVPLASTLRALMELCLYWGFGLAALLYFWIAQGHWYLQIKPRLLVGLLGLVLCLLYATAIGLITSVIYPRARDIRYVVRYGMQFWLVITPVFYALDTLPHWAQTLAQVNPLTPLVGMAQYGFLGADVLHPWGTLWSLAAIALTTAVGLWFFNRMATQWIGIYTLSEGDDDDEADFF
jgi:ABC-type polysaccharide/polyol phosphate export permease